ncbi:MAG: YajQ family cyclic di-GMP-binding protein [Opitutaceae bacterium]|nr:YajQ family cyclic di-GMP-binding protein [Opitutaceae bacterium]
MPSFDITCEVDLTEVKNATNMVRKELQTRFDFRGVVWEMIEEEHTITLTSESEYKLEAILEVLRDRLARRGVSQKNVEVGKMETSSTGRARQVLTLRDSIPADVAKQIAVSLRGADLKVQAAIEHGKVRVSGKKRDDLQSAIAHVRGLDLTIAVGFGNFRE